MFSPRNAIAAALASVSMAACAVADYKVPVNSFQKATANAQVALIAADQRVTAAYRASIEEDILATNLADRKWLVEFEDRHCQLSSSRCQLIVRSLTDRTVTERFPSDPLLKNMLTLMQAIVTYADNLSAVVNSTTAAEVTASVNSALGGIESLAGSIDEISNTSTETTVSEYKTTIGKAMSWFAGRYIARIQIDGLRHATGNAAPIISRASFIFEETTALQATITNRSSVDRVDAAGQKFEGAGTTKANLDALLKVAAAYDRELRVSPSTVFRKFGVAHQALADHLAGRNVTMGQAISQINGFLDETAELMSIVRTIAGEN